MTKTARLFAIFALFATLFPATVRHAGAQAAPDAQVAPSARAAVQETWFVELGVGMNARRSDGYNRELERQGYRQDLDFALPIGPDIAFGAALHRYVSALVRYDFLESNTYRMRSGAEKGDIFEWTTRSVSLAARARLPLYSERLVPFAEVGFGLGVARPRVTTMGKETTDHQFDVALRGALGVAAGGEHVGGYVTVGYTRAAILKEAGHEHDDGGLCVAAGLRIRSLRWWW